jgi:hypothetical protein
LAAVFKRHLKTDLIDSCQGKKTSPLRLEGVAPKKILFILNHRNLYFLSPSLSKISRSIEGTAPWTNVALYFMPGAEQWYRHQSWLLWHPFELTKLLDSFFMTYKLPG